MNFLEWTAEREELLEEGRRQRQASYSVDANPNIGDVIISNPVAFFKKVMYVPAGKGAELKSPRLKDATINPKDFSSFNIQNIDGRTIHSVRRTTGTYASKGKGADKLFGLERLRDVTDSFPKDGARYFVDLGRGKTIEQLYATYQNLTRHSIITSPEAKQNARIGAFIGDQPSPYRSDDRTVGQQSVANTLIKGAETHVEDNRHQRAKLITRQIQGLQAGRPVDRMSYSDVLQSMKNMVKDAEDVQWLRKNGYSDIVDTLHDTGLSQDVAGETMGRVAPPESNWDKFMNQPQQRVTNPAIAPQSTPDERMAQLLKTAAYDPSIMSHTRHWKRHNDIKRYDYFAE